MRVYRDFRRRGSYDEITISMSLSELRETVDWLEGIDPSDGATKDWREWLDQVDPSGDDGEPARGGTAHDGRRRDGE
jgi:hypothetical protein